MSALCCKLRSAEKYLFGREIEPISDDDGQEGAETIQNRHNRDLDDAMDPALDVFRCFLDISFSVMPRAFGVRVCLCSMCALAHESFLVVIEEVGGFEGFGYEEDATKGPDHRDDTFDNVEPASFVNKRYSGCMKAQTHHLHPDHPATPFI
jgi:hypothetical protein